MKLENEPGFVVQSPPRKSYNPFESDDEETDGFVKGGVNAYDIKSFEKNADSLTFHLDNADLSWEEAILGQPHPILNRAIPADADGEEGLFRKDTQLFTDKSVTEYDLPELMVCYKENAYHSIKDIGIDEGVPVHDKVWIKSRDHHESKKLDTNVDLSLESEHQALPLVEELKTRSENHFEKDASVRGRAEDSLKNSGLSCEDLERQQSSSQCGTDDSIKLDEFKQDLSKIESNSSLQSTGDDSRDHQLSKTSELNYTNEEKKENKVSDVKNGIDNASLEHAEESSMKPSDVNSIGNIAEASENRREEATSSQSMELHVLKESAGNGLANALSYNSKVESGSIVLDFNSSSIKEHEKEKQMAHLNATVEKLPETQTMPVEKLSGTQTAPVEKLPGTQTTPVEKLPETHTVSVEKPLEIQTMPVEKPSETQTKPAEKPTETQTMPIEKPPITQSMSRIDEEAPDMDRRVHGESSFSAEMPLPASITYMGPSARCGSISLRSESSTGSTRSFAFPVLQAEWNSSPVRMTKAEQRNFRKHRGWVHSLMCCKF